MGTAYGCTDHGRWHDETAMIRNIGRRTVMKAIGGAGAAGLVSGSASAESRDVHAASGAQGQLGPNRAGKFVVKFDGDTIARWRAVSLPAVSIGQETYEEGTQAPQAKKVFGQPTYDDLEMERGFKPDDTLLWDWINDIRQGKVDGSRREIAVIVNDTDGNARTRWEFTSCWPKNYEPPDLDASADGDVATESITVAFDKMIRAQ
jgi:phage tail-like protein